VHILLIVSASYAVYCNTFVIMFVCFFAILCSSFSALMLLVGRQEGRPAVKVLPQQFQRVYFLGTGLMWSNLGVT